ncbi:THAP domain-containing protein 2-like [Stegodyphus dumicola]|uniref:THAP domain-containing protein 2-like n=1 Tax=Stegodyphus dumicola TaxID=202533 RepID=UPI0015B07730|nr:THAP domain-containing protein 2-like [Stegodyphus dumicola]
MPHKCAVATCRGNYKNGPKVAVFKFPNETELRMKWIRSLRRKDGFQPTKHTRVCELHFRSDEIIREIEMYDEKSAKLIKAPISRPRLKKGCIPSQFPDGPSYMSSNSVSRMSPEKKKARLEEKYLEKAIEERGNLCGMAYNCEKAATSAYVFMIRSLLSPFKDVAHILPVKSLNAEDLYQYLKKIIIGLENIGYRIVAVVSDNNSINKKRHVIILYASKN